jgi:hypothetical protein
LAALQDHKVDSVAHTTDPNAFFAEYVLPAIADWKRQPTSIRLATLALCELDNLCEHWLRHEAPLTQQEVTLKRNELGKDKLFIAIARDIHDTHKHGGLNRITALIKSAAWADA